MPSWAYNGLGLRVGKTDSTGTYSYVCDGTTPGSPILSDGQAVYTPGLSERRNGSSLFYNSDDLGNLWTADDGTGQAEAGAYLFTGFGASLYAGSGSAGASPLKYGGANDCQTDGDTGLVLMGCRYYDTRIGRFINLDPIGDGDNWYAYADNSPSNEVDPDGLMPMDGPGSSPVGSPGYADGAVSGLGGSMEEYGVVWHPYFVGGAPYYSYETPGVSHDFYHTYWAPDWFDGTITNGGMIAAESAEGGFKQGKFKQGFAFLAKSVLPSNCFIAGTLVQEQGKKKPIQSIRKGEMVATRNLQTGKTEYRQVVRTFKSLAYDTITVQFADAKTGKIVDTLTATLKHPFYVLGQGMTALGKLGIGTLIVTRAGPPVVVHSLVRHHFAAGVFVYNIEVEGDHTYFVGNSAEWVHNSSAIADAIANGHAFIKHVIKRGEFAKEGIKTVEEFAKHIANVMDTGDVKMLKNGRIAYWDDATGTVVINDPSHGDMGTAFQPNEGRAYYDRL